MSDPRLSPDEDAELRLLHSLTTFGSGAHSMATRYHALRGRDRRNIVREPDETMVASPIEKKIWADPARNPSAEEAMGDSREILAKTEPKKSGFFRR